MTDNLTGLIWLKNANCFGLRTWEQALSDANTLAGGYCGLIDGSKAGEWRLPNVKELQSLIDYDFFDPVLSNTAGTGKWTQGDPFTGVQMDYYWSSTTYVEVRASCGACTWAAATCTTTGISRRIRTTFGRSVADNEDHWVL